jgi:hypothetical protein
MMSTKKTPPQAWFRNPTEEAVMHRAEKEEQKKLRQPRVYICSPFAGDTENNVAKALKYCRFALTEGMFPIAPHCYLPRFMDDDNMSERALALSFGLRLLKDCTAIWVFGDTVSEGMEREILSAVKHGIEVRKFNENCEELLA